MKNFGKIIYFIALLSFFVFGCNGNKEEQQAQVLQEQTQTQTQDTATGAKNQQQIQTDNQIALTNEALPPEKLEQILPKDFQGAKRLPSNFGKFNDDGKIWTTASVEFSFSKPGGVVVQIFDYGSSSNIPEEEKIYFDKLPEETGYQTDKIIIPNGKGYLKWDKEYRRGKLRMLYLDRFVIKIDGTNLPEDAPGLDVFLNKINFNLIKL